MSTYRLLGYASGKAISAELMGMQLMTSRLFFFAPIVLGCSPWDTLPSEVLVGGPIHLAHSAHADLGGDFVGTESGAGGEGQFA